MLFYTAIGFLSVIHVLAGALSHLTDAETKNVTLGNESIVTKTDVFRLLLNQETIIRMSLVKDVNSLMKDMVEMRESMTSSNKLFQNAEKEITSLKNEIQLLKSENQKFKKQAMTFQKEISSTDMRFNETEVQFEKCFNEKFKEFEKNTSSILNSIKIEATDLFVKLLDLNKQTTELNMSIPNLINKKLTEYSDKVNSSISEINHKVLSSKDFQKRLAHNLSALENDLTSIRKIIPEMKASVGFTVGVTSTFST